MATLRRAECDSPKTATNTWIKHQMLQQTARLPKHFNKEFSLLKGAELWRSDSLERTCADLYDCVGVCIRAQVTALPLED